MTLAIIAELVKGMKDAETVFLQRLIIDSLSLSEVFGLIREESTQEECFG